MRPYVPSEPSASSATAKPVSAKVKIKTGPPLPFSSLIELEKPLPIKHLPLEKIVLSSDMTFEPSKDLLTAAGEAKLKTLMPTFRKAKSHPIVIVGHTDSMGFDADNKALTLHQAQRIKGWLVAHGLAKAIAVEARGEGSNSPLPSAQKHTINDGMASGARNRRIEIVIDPNRVVEAEQVAAKPVVVAPPPADKSAEDDTNEGKAADAPPDLTGGLLDADSTMIPVSEEDLNPNKVPDNGSDGKSAHHKVNEGEWGRGGSDFGNNVSSFGQMSGYGGDASQYNAEGKRVVKVTPSTADLEAKRKETVEAQNEFGLWRDP